MIPKQKYENIINTIEELIEKDPDMSDREISKRAFKVTPECPDDRSRNCIFKFLLDTTISQYISERRLMASFKALMFGKKDEKENYKKAYYLSGTGSMQAFATKYKAFFGFPPTDTLRVNDTKKYKAVPTWESFTNSNEDGYMDKRFGVNIEQFKVVQEALNLQSFFDLSDSESEFAYQIYKENNFPLEECFKFISDYNGRSRDEEKDSRLKEDLGNQDVQLLYFIFKFNFDDIFEILLKQYLVEFTKSIKEYDEVFLRGCAKYRIKYKDLKDRKDTYEEIYDYYMNMKTSQYTMYDFFLYVSYMSYSEKEIAFKMLIPGLDREEFLKREQKIKSKLFSNDESYDTSLEDWNIDKIIEWEEGKINPEVWDDDYYYSQEHDEVDEYDEESLEEYEVNMMPDSYEALFEDDFEETIVDSTAEKMEYEEFDYDKFKEISESLSEVEPVYENTVNNERQLSIFYNLDVKEYWNNYKKLYLLA